MTLTEKAALALLVAVASSCRDAATIQRTPTSYEWPDSFAFLAEYVAETRADRVVVTRYEERKRVRFAVRDDQYLVWHDSVVKETLVPGLVPVVEPYEPEDTLHYYLTLSRRGVITHSEPGCDPALEACRSALPSALPLELRRLIPRLPLWAPPRGYVWEDTLIFDDTPRPRGTRGSVVTSYRIRGDTTIAGDAMWILVWHAVQRSFAGVGGFLGIASAVPIEETGIAYIDKRRGIPVFVTWAGGVVAPPPLRATGVTGTGFRGRAYLAGSTVERLLAPPP